MAQEFTIQPSPRTRQTKGVTEYGVSGLWTPQLTFVTPGNLAITYVDNEGRYSRFMNEVRASFYVLTSTFTHTTASNDARLTGLPFPAAGQAFGGVYFSQGSMSAYLGIVATGFTEIVPFIGEGKQIIQFGCEDAEGSAPVFLSASQMPSGTQIGLIGSVIYSVANY